MAFKDYRPDLLMKAQNDRTLHRLETAIVRLAKSLRIPGDEDEGGERKVKKKRVLLLLLLLLFRVSTGAGDEEVLSSLRASSHLYCLFFHRRRAVGGDLQLSGGLGPLRFRSCVFALIAGFERAPGAVVLLLLISIVRRTDR